MEVPTRIIEITLLQYYSNISSPLFTNRNLDEIERDMAMVKDLFSEDSIEYKTLFAAMKKVYNIINNQKNARTISFESH